MRAKYSFAFVAIGAAVGINLALSGASNSADRSSPLGGEMLLAQAGPLLGPAGDQTAPALPTPAVFDDDDFEPQAGSEIQTRGPVHEAFARPVEMNAEPGPIGSKRPPEPIDEIPPDAAPDGENVEWISGYWAWDDDRNDYLWISGVYRNCPPNQTWVAGYWSEVAGGYQWTSGFWATNGNTGVQYLAEAPPQSLEVGPNSDAPSENHFWVPGTHIYRNTNYAWQPGYWSPSQENWVYVPAQYNWTPAGYVFVPGFWDHAIERRGCLFAPVYFTQPVYTQPAYVYTPRVLINVGLFNDCMFVRPRYCHYYVGDYFEPRYATYGFRPWFSAGVQVGGGIGVGVGYGYDPLFVYANWRNTRRNPNWLANTRRHYDNLRDNPGRRPPHTYAAQQQLLRKAGNDQRRDFAVASTLRQAQRDPNRAGVRVQKVSVNVHNTYIDQSKQFKQVTVERARLEKTNIVPGIADGSAGNRRDRGPRGGDKNDGDRKGPGGDRVAAGGDRDGPVNAKTLKIPTVATARKNTGDAGVNRGPDKIDGGAVSRNLDPTNTNRSRGNSANQAFGGKDNSERNNDNQANDNNPNGRNQNRKSSGDNADGGSRPTVGRLPGDDQSDRKGRAPGQDDGKDASKKGGNAISQNPGGKDPDGTPRTRVNANPLGGDGNRQNGTRQNDNGQNGNRQNDNGQNANRQNASRQNDSRQNENRQNDNNPGTKSARSFDPPAGNGTNPDLRRLNTQGSNTGGQSNPGGQLNPGGQSNSRGRSNPGAQSNSRGQPTPALNPPPSQPRVRSDAGGGNARGRGNADNPPPTVRSNNPPPTSTRSLNVPNNGGGGRGNPAIGGGGGGNQQRATPRQNNNNPGGSNNPAVRSNPPNPKPEGGGGSKGPPAKDDDDDSKRKKRSETGSPKTNMNLMPSERALVDVRGGVKREELAIERATTTGADDFALESKPQGSLRDEILDGTLNDRQKKSDSETANNSSPNGSTPMSWRVPGLQSPGLGRVNSLAGQNGSNGGGVNGAAGSGQSSNNRGSGLTLKSAKTNAESVATPNGEYTSRPGSDVRSATMGGGPNSKYDYQAMANRGKSISQNSGLAVGSGPRTEGIDRGSKDPVTRFGMGSPSGRSMYGPGGSSGSSSGISSSASAAASGPGGSGSYMSSSSLPQVPRWQGSGRDTGGVLNYVPSSTNSSNSYDPRQR